MGLMTALGIGGALLAGGAAASQASQANKANKRYADAAGRAAGQVEEAYTRARSDLAPFVGIGQAATSPLAQLMGLDVAGSPIMQEQANAPDWLGYLKEHPDVLAHYQNLERTNPKLLERLGLSSFEDYARHHYEGSGRMAGYTMPTVSGGRLDASGRPEPAAPGSGAPTTTSPPPPAQTPTEKLMSLPGVEAMMKAGTDAVTQSAYATGKSGGGVLQGIHDRAMRDMYGVYDAETARLMQVMGMGQTGATNLGQIGAGTSANAAQMMLGGEAARASSYSPLAAGLGAFGGFLAGDAGQGTLGDIGEWWKRRRGGETAPSSGRAGFTGRLGTSMGMT